MEFEIGRGKKARRAYGFLDIAFVPEPRLDQGETDTFSRTRALRERPVLVLTATRSGC